MSETEDYGARVRAARNFARLSQEELATQTGLDRKLVLNIEKNAHEMTVSEARRIAFACRIPVSFLVEGWMPSVSERLAIIEDELRLLAAESAARDAEVLKRIEKGSEPSDHSPQRRHA